MDVKAPIYYSDINHSNTLGYGYHKLTDKFQDENIPQKKSFNSLIKIRLVIEIGC